LFDVGLIGEMLVLFVGAVVYGIAAFDCWRS
jgi:hypothetical protein